MSEYFRLPFGEMRPCWVRPDRERWPDHADQEWPGFVGAWRKREGRWEAYVEFSTGVGENRAGWFDQDQVRQRDD
jgi:hypothetical protein